MVSTNFDDFFNNFKPNVIPQKDDFFCLLTDVINVLQNEDEFYRPKNSKGFAGSVICFSDNLPTIILPDLHARYFFLLKVLDFCYNEVKVIDLLKDSKIRIICLGDALHSEIRGKERWIKALYQYENGNEQNEYMLEEMSEGLSTVYLIMALKKFFPNNFHFLKGNHENIFNEDFLGNHSFRKFVYEGQMTLDFMLSYFGFEFTEIYSKFEKLLPLFVKDTRFLASHAEPLKFYKLSKLIDASLDGNVIEHLTWTQNGFAPSKIVKKFLKKYCKNFKKSWYFAGHRSIRDIYNLNEENHFIQFHNSNKMTIAIISDKESFNPKNGFVIL